MVVDKVEDKEEDKEGMVDMEDMSYSCHNLH
jgi:hypothetical protein